MPDRKPKLRGDDPRFNQTKLRGDARTVHLPDGVWQWKTNGHEITIYDPAGKRHDTTYQVVLGWSDERFDQVFGDGKWPDDSGPMITPGEVKAYVERKKLDVRDN